MRTPRRHIAFMLFVSAFVFAFCGSALAQKKIPTIGSEREAPVRMVPSKDSIYIFAPVASYKNVAGFNVYRADVPMPAATETAKNEGMSCVEKNVYGKSQEEAKAEIDELEKNDPIEAKRRKDAYKQKYEEVCKPQQEAAANEIKGRAQRIADNKILDTDYKLMTPSPVSPVKKAENIADAMGADAMELLESLRIKSIDELWVNYAKNPQQYDMFANYSLPLNVILGRLYHDKDVRPDGSYYYKIVLVDAAGKTVKEFDPIRAMLKPPPLPAPEGLKGEARDGGAVLSWKKPERSPANGFVVYRAQSKEGPFVRKNKNVVSVMGEPTFTDYSLANGQTNYFYITAVDLVGNQSDPSEIVEVTPKDLTPPSPPTNVKVALKDGKVFLTWDMNLEPDMDAYTVSRSESLEKDYATISPTIPSDVTAFTDETIEDGKMYYYQLTAADKNRNVSAHSARTPLKLPDTVSPNIPLGFNGKPAGKNVILLTWSESKDPDLYGYNIYKGRDTDNLQKANQEPVLKKALKYEDVVVVSGETYYYSLVAVDTSMNESKLTDPIRVTAPDRTPPDYPMGLFAMSAEDSRVTISWAPNQERDVVAYRLYYSPDPEKKFTKQGEDILKDTLSVVDEPVENGTKRWYYLTAVDASGNESEASGKAQALPMDSIPPQPPSPPTGALEGKIVKLSWPANPEKDIAGYFVWRVAVSRTGETKVISGEKPLPKTKLEYQDALPSAGTEYWYRVSAVDTSKNESRESEAAGPFKYEEALRIEGAAPSTAPQKVGVKTQPQKKGTAAGAKKQR